MKKLITLSFLVLFAFTINAQKVTNLQKSEFVSNKMIFDNEESNQTVAPPYRDMEGIPIGASQNIYGIYLAGPHQVMYNSAINTVVFTHRALLAGGGDSGELAFDFSTDGGATWTTEAWISQQAEAFDAECRYPSISIYNPEGNTDPANARIVANGPALMGYGASLGWGYSYQTDATITANPTTNEWYGSNNGDDSDFHPYGLEMGPDGTAWSMSTDYAADDDNNSYDDFYVNKATYDGTQFVWDAGLLEINPDFLYVDGDKAVNAWDIAVHPTDANIVYAVVNYADVSDTKDVPTPHVWKTTDGGANWTQLPAIDVVPLESFFEPFIYHEEGDPQRPYVTDIDVTVDANGRMHALCTVSAGGSGGINWGWWNNAFITFTDGSPAIPNLNLVDFSTTDGTDWTVEYIDYIESIEAAWGDVSTMYHAQISRNESGTDIFYTWSESYQYPDSVNGSPNMIYSTWNVDNGMEYTEGQNLTVGTGAQNICFFPQTSPVVIDNGDNTFELPLVIAMIDFQNGNDMDQANYLYLKGVEMTRNTSNAPPSIVNVTNANDFSEIMIEFSDALEQTSAEAIENYTIATGKDVTFTSATLDASTNTVTLGGVTGLEHLSNYILTVNGVIGENGATIENATYNWQASNSISELEMEVKIYPNPVNGIMNITSDEIINNISIYNIVGQEIFSENINNNSYRYNTEDLPNGLYTIKLFSENKTITKKVIIK